MYEHGEGVDINLQKAKEFYEKAANLGDNDALKALEKLHN